MTLKKKTLLGSLALAIVSLPACTRGATPAGPGQGVGQRDQRVFYVSLYTDPAHPDQCFADWPQATLWKDKHQTVQWISDDGKAYIVDFGPNGSPFAQPTFVVPANGVQPSGDLSSSSQKDHYYPYAIRPGTNPSAICKPASDPGLYVK